MPDRLRANRNSLTTEALYCIVEQGRCKALMKVWNYTTEDTCSCGSVQTMSHLLECADAPRCSPEDLAEPTPSAVACARDWQNDI
ncbi:hypothetical protein F7725_025674 [Dissostichus mawsoni]|uniref:Uncharacterized protein n=1 Tax=Dissostichus mawsoni TaxID=36200 RepID=A0A7J5XBV1_DISMA|nr:hypothetical protein F7725_025674 [Dissostichus mawsoni]